MQNKKLLAVLDRMPAEFRLEDFIVASWRSYPHTFGLDGFPQYPDSHKVTTNLYGKRGLIAAGFMVKDGAVCRKAIRKAV